MNVLTLHVYSTTIPFFFIYWYITLLTLLLSTLYYPDTRVVCDVCPGKTEPCQSAPHFLHNLTVTWSQSGHGRQDDNMRKPLRLLLPTAAISTVLLSLLSSHHAPPRRHLQLSSSLASRTPWRDDEFCKKFNISYLQPKSGDICPLASFPGSGSTWVRYLIEGATGVFTGSVYKDLELQMMGFWGEIRDWRDGTTIVQKTHDGGAQYIRSRNREKVDVD